MQDFNEFVKNGETESSEEIPKPFRQMAETVAKSFEGKGESDLIRAIYKEAERGRKAGTLTDADLDRFSVTVAPLLNASQKKKLESVVKKLKKM